MKKITFLLVGLLLLSGCDCLPSNEEVKRTNEEIKRMQDKSINACTSSGGVPIMYKYDQLVMEKCVFPTIN